MVTREAPRYRGREPEMHLLDDVLEEAASGRLAAVLVEGEAGIGKTRLLSEGFTAARGRDFQVASGRAQELERTRPFGLMADAFGCDGAPSDPRRAAIASLLSTHAGDERPVTVTSDPGLQFQAVDAFVDLAEAEALRRPLIIGVDDLQWADRSSLLTLDALVRRLTYVPAVVVGCMRPEPRTAELERVIDTVVAAGGHRLALDRLGADAVTQLVAEIVGGAPGPRLMTDVSAAAGNALFVVELASALQEEGTVEVVDGRAEVAETTLPPSLRLTVLRRLGFLPAETLDLLRPASILGSAFTLAELSAITTRPVFELSSLLGEAFTAGVLTDDGSRVRFRHDLVREAIYTDLPPSVRVDLHREAGRRLAASGVPAVRVAEHVARGAARGDSDAIGWLTAAAREAAATSPAIAAELLDQAVELTYASDADRDALVAERAGILMWAGRIAEAEAACRELLDRPHDPAVDVPARMCLGRCLMVLGRSHEAVRELRRLDRAPTATDAQRAAGLGWTSVAHIALGELDAAVAMAEHARSAATRAGDDATSSMACTVLAIGEEFRAHLGDALHLVDEGVRLADRSPGRSGHRYPHHVIRGHLLIELDRFGEARTTLETGMRISEQLGMRWPLAAYQVVAAVERFAAGAWDDAVGAAEAGLELAEETGERNNVALAHSVVSLIALHRNALDDAEQAASAAVRELVGSGPGYHGHWAAWAQALWLEAVGDDAEALVTLADCWDRCVAAGLAAEYPVLGPDLVRLALAADRRARAEEVTRTVARVDADNDVASLTGAALRCRGLLDDDPQVLCAAADAYAEGRRPLQRALAAEDAGTALGRAGDVDAAVQLLDRAHDLYTQLDAARDQARTRATLRDLGVRRGRRGTRNRPRTGWASLTPTELEVAGLVSEGLTNPQIGERLFVSRRTVQTHLTHVFRKLAMSSRSELAAAITSRQAGSS